MNMLRNQEGRLNAKSVVLSLLYALVIVCANNSAAVEIEGLYDALVPITERSQKAHAEAVRQGFKQVMIKITGSSKVVDSPRLIQRLKSASQYVNGYSYQSVAGQGDGATSQQMMKINFSPEVIERLLREDKLPIWPADREPLLIWLVVDDVESGRQLVGSDAYPQVFAVLDEVAVQRGIPLVFPVLDLQDRFSLRPDDAWQLNPEQLQAASARYQAKHWVIIRFYQTSQGQWRGASWRSGLDQDGLLTSHQSDSLDSFVFNALNVATDGYSRQYTFIPQGRDNSLTLVFDGVESYRSFKHLRDYLQGLEIVSEIKLIALQDAELKVDVDVEGDSQVFFAALKRDARFQEMNSVNEVGLRDSTQRFLWLEE